MKGDPCSRCADRFTCGPYPCPRFGPEDIDTAAMEAAEEAMDAQILEPGADATRTRQFSSLEELIAYSREHPRHIVGLSDDLYHPYRGGVRIEAVKF